jgi:hypothetical protein
MSGRKMLYYSVLLVITLIVGQAAERGQDVRYDNLKVCVVHAPEQ